MPLPPELSKKIRRTLVRCPQLQSHARLRALFRDAQIATWRDEVQDAASPGERVELLIDLLLERHDTQGRRAFVLFLRVLSEAQPEGDALRGEVLALAADFAPAVAGTPRSAMPIPSRTTSMIDREEAIAIFQQMLEPGAAARVLCIIGTEKMGKSHLLRIYRHRAQRDYRALCALVDMRALTLSYSDVLHICSQQLGIAMPTYQAARDDLTQRLEKNVGTLSQLLSKFSASGRDEASASRHERHRLTAAFVQDLRAAPASIPTVLLFDTLEQASADMQAWVTNNLLTALYPLDHVRVVLAGRRLPETPTTVQDVCCSYELQAVAPDHYRHYCNTIGVALADRELALLYEMWDGNPGFLVEMTPKLLAWGGAR